MKALFIILFIFVMETLFVVNCVPTSVLVQNSETEHNFKEKPSHQNVIKSMKNTKNVDMEIQQPQPPSVVVVNEGTGTATTTKSTNLDVKLKQSNNLHHLPTTSTNDYNNNHHHQPSFNDKLLLKNSLHNKSTPHKRGINNQMLYKWRNGNNDDNFYNQSPITSDVIKDDSDGGGGGNLESGGGVWGDTLDPPILYSSNSNSDFNDYLPHGQFHNKPYENLQNLLNHNDENLEDIEDIEDVASDDADVLLNGRGGGGRYHQQYPPIPVQYYLGDRRKRSNKYNTGFDLPIYSNHEQLSSSTKLTPADMLALVALVEAGQRNSNNDGYYYKQPAASSYYQSNLLDDDDLNHEWSTLPLVENDKMDEQSYYAGMPYNLENIPRYEMLREQKYLPKNHYGPGGATAKRFMVSKKKRSLGHFYNEPIPSLNKHQLQQFNDQF